MTAAFILAVRDDKLGLSGPFEMTGGLLWPIEKTFLKKAVRDGRCFMAVIQMV
jgi:hypothetical protein